MKNQVQTQRLILKPFSLSDAEKNYKMSIEKGMKDWIPDQVYESKAQAREVLEYLIQQCDKELSPKDAPIVYGVYLTNNSELIGHVGLSPLVEDVEVGYAIEEKEQKKGYATEAVKAMTKWGLEKFNLSHVVGAVEDKNIYSCKVLEKAEYKLVEEKVVGNADRKVNRKIYKMFNESS